MTNVLIWLHVVDATTVEPLSHKEFKLKFKLEFGDTNQMAAGLRRSFKQAPDVAYVIHY